MLDPDATLHARLSPATPDRWSGYTTVDLGPVAGAQPARELSFRFRIECDDECCALEVIGHGNREHIVHVPRRLADHVILAILAVSPDAPPHDPPG